MLRWGFVAILLLATASAQAEDVRLKSGVVKSGEIVEKTDRDITLQQGDNVFTIPFNMVAEDQVKALMALPNKTAPAAVEPPVSESQEYSKPKKFPRRETSGGPRSAALWGRELDAWHRNWRQVMTETQGQPARHPGAIALAVFLGLVGIGGLFIWQRWARTGLWVLSIPTLFLGLSALGDSGFAEELGPGLSLVFSVAISWPVIGCLLGELWEHWRAAKRVPAVVYISRDDAAVNYGAKPWPVAERVECKGITTMELLTLWAILRASERKEAPTAEFPCLSRHDPDGLLIHRFPDDLTAHLSRLPRDRTVLVASTWESTKKWGLTSEGARCLVEDLSRLARVAVDSGRDLYVWNHFKKAKGP